MKQSQKLEAIFNALPEHSEQQIGQRIIELMQLKEAKTGNSPRGLKSYDPPRYYTASGTKTALGVFRCVVGSIMDGLYDAGE